MIIGFLIYALTLASAQVEPFEQAVFPDGLPSKKIDGIPCKGVLQWKTELAITPPFGYDEAKIFIYDVSYTHPESFLTWHDLRFNVVIEKSGQWRVIYMEDLYPLLRNVLNDDWDLRDSEIILQNFELSPGTYAIYLNYLALSHTQGCADYVKLLNWDARRMALTTIFELAPASSYNSGEVGNSTATFNHVYPFDIEKDGTLELLVLTETKTRKPSSNIDSKLSEVEVYRFKDEEYIKVQTIPNLPKAKNELPRCSKNIFLQLP
jgi:hypothetical protein